MNNNFKIGIIGLGYVGFPLACLFAKKYEVIGFDLKQDRIDELNAGIDSTNEVSIELHKEALCNGMRFTSQQEELKSCNIYIVAVPTPIDDHHHPDLSPIESASRTVGNIISKGNIVIFESTVYPGATENVCAPIIESVSGLKLNQGFYMGYSPERINPGDKKHTVENILKITSGSTPEVADTIDELYNSVLLGGTYRASSIKIAEAAKIMENTQRDINIAFMNEMAIVFNAIGIDIYDVLDAAKTKWNFLNFSPGLVGGHCISVDPYYLIEHSKYMGVYPRLITEARRINNSMGEYIVNNVIQKMNIHGISALNSRILILGFTFKENCPDTRNTKVYDIYTHLKRYTDNIQVFDPWANPDAVHNHYCLNLTTDSQSIKQGTYDAVIYCVKHDQFDQLELDRLCKPGGVFYDVKGHIDRTISTDRL